MVSEQNLRLTERTGLKKGKETGRRKGKIEFSVVGIYRERVVYNGPTYQSKALLLVGSFSTSALLTFWAGEFFVAGGWRVHCRMLGIIPGLCSLDATSTRTSIATTKNHLQHCQMSPGGQNHPS